MHNLSIDCDIVSHIFHNVNQVPTHLLPRDGINNITRSMAPLTSHDDLVLLYKLIAMEFLAFESVKFLFLFFVIVLPFLSHFSICCIILLLEGRGYAFFLLYPWTSFLYILLENPNPNNIF